MTALTLQAVRKRFGRTETLHGIDLHIAEGEFVVFVGPSGCGKSTLLRLIAGLESVSEGRILFGERDLTHASPSERRVAMVFQSYALYPHMTVQQNLSFGMRMRGEPRDTIARKLEHAVRILQLEPYLARKPGELSGGQCQRVAIGRALVQEPAVFLFDEPLSNLDAELRLRMRVEIAALHETLRRTMVYVTHDQVEAMTLADRIVVLRDGRIEQVGTPRALYDQPANLFVAGFLGSPRINVVPRPDSQASAAHRQFWSLALGSGQDDPSVMKAGLRAEHLDVAAPSQGVPADVAMAEHLGDSSILHLRVDGMSELLHARVEVGQALLQAGTSVGLVPRQDQVMRFDSSDRRLS